MRILVLALLLVPALASAEGPVVKQAACTLKWDVPQLNDDGTNLGDLKEFGVYVAADPTTLTAPVAVVPATAADPAAGATASWSCVGLPIGQQSAQVDAVNMTGKRSPRSAPFPFTVAADASPQAPSNLRLGP